MRKTAQFGPMQKKENWAETRGKQVTFDPNSPLFGNKPNLNIEVNARRDFVQLSIVEAQALIAAHEMGHVTNKLPKDSNDPAGALSIHNNGTIQEKCFSDVPVIRP
jgi:hypothetical protein